MQVFKDDIFRLKQIPLNKNNDIFETILEERKDDADRDRFFLNFLPQEAFVKYDFDNPESIKSFTRVCYTIDSPLMKMGGYNMSPNHLQDDFRYAGIKMSDPYGKIYGSFDIRNGIVTYSPIFPHFYEERDLIKFANDEYFTTMSFEDIMMQQIGKSIEFYVHTGNYKTARELLTKGHYLLEKISQDQMVEFAFNPNAGAKVLKKYLG